MILLLLSALILAEAALAAYTIRSGSEQPAARLVVRATALGLVLLGAAVGPFTWGLRYYALAGWLLLLTAMAGVRHFRPSTRQVTTARVVLRAAGVSLVTVLAAAPALVFPEYSPIEATGELDVARTVHTVTDPVRTETYDDSGMARRVTVEYWYPDLAAASPEQRDRTFPLVVFSHGGTGVRTGNESLFGELASHGYVVASIDHTFHALVSTDDSGRTVWIDRGYLRGLMAEDARADPEQSHAFYEEWMSIRMGDIDLVIDHILAEAARPGTEDPVGMVDPEQVVVAGHSLGGSAALGIGRTRDDVAAVVALESPFLADIHGASGGEFVWDPAPYPVPVLLVYSDSAWGHLDEWPQYARNHELLTTEPPGVVHLHLGGVGHLGLTDLALASPLLTRLADGTAPEYPPGPLEALNRLVLEFLALHR